MGLHWATAVFCQLVGHHSNRAFVVDHTHDTKAKSVLHIEGGRILRRFFEAKFRWTFVMFADLMVKELRLLANLM